MGKRPKLGQSLKSPLNELHWVCLSHIKMPKQRNLWCVQVRGGGHEAGGRTSCRNTAREITCFCLQHATQLSTWHITKGSLSASPTCAVQLFHPEMFVFFLSVLHLSACQKHHQQAHSLVMNPPEDLLLFLHMGSFRHLYSEFVIRLFAFSHTASLWACHETIQSLVHVWKQLHVTHIWGWSSGFWLVQLKNNQQPKLAFWSNVPKFCFILKHLLTDDCRVPCLVTRKLARNPLFLLLTRAFCFCLHHPLQMSYIHPLLNVMSLGWMLNQVCRIHNPVLSVW